MIYGIGHDIINIDRVQKLLNVYENKLYTKVLSNIEQLAIPNNKIDIYLSKRIVAKEAFAKACGVGFINPIFMNKITVTNDKYGKPQIVVSSDIKQWLDKKDINKIFLSISDEVKSNSFRMASAYVILEQ